MSPFDQKDYLGEPVIINRGYQLCALLTACEATVSSLQHIGTGSYRDRVESSLATTLELAESIASDLLSALEKLKPTKGAKS